MKMCKFCKKTYSDRGVKYHQNYCKMDPTPLVSPSKTDKWREAMKLRVHENQFTKAKKEGRKINVSNETRMKISKSSTGRKHTEDYKLMMSELAKKRGLGGVTQSRWIQYKGKTLGSSYELSLAKDLDNNHIAWDTCSRFNYIDPFGKDRTYTPDFYLMDYDVYLDPKNDFLIEHINPALGFNDCEKIKLVEEQNNIKVFVLNKYQLTWNSVKDIITT